MNSLDIHEVLRHLPHRFPFVMIDRVLDWKADESLTAVKNVSINEPFFPGHFPHHPVMPGVMILEAMAQACAVLSMKTLGKLPQPDSVYYFLGIDNARFKRPVGPGDVLKIDVAVKRKMRGIWLFDASATVDGELAASAELMCTYKGI